jgi:DNA-directed RNA polymerase subunit N (RpoN/RPB10)
MSKEEQIALELTRISINDTSGKKLLDRYKSYLKELKKDNVIEKEQNKLLDELGTYKYIINAIKELIERDESNFVLKEDLLKKIGGLYD